MPVREGAVRQSGSRNRRSLVLEGRPNIEDEEPDIQERGGHAEALAEIGEVDLAIEITVVTDSLPTTRDIDRVRDAVTQLGVPVRGRVPQPS